MSREVVLDAKPLGFPWETPDPFLFCAYHLDAYPAGREDFGPKASLEGREIGSDFAGKDGWRMYHGDVVPGFPQHPHRGFETVTIVRRGLIDHSDSLGAAARFGAGDVQWVTAGRGIVHSEMFPLLNREQPNPLELFQIWLNLPRTDKLCEPHFTMMWAPSVPKLSQKDEHGRETEVTVVAGRLGDEAAPAAPPRSWAGRPPGDVAIWTIRMDPGARWTLPPAAPGSNRRLYVYRGSGIRVAGRDVAPAHAIDVSPEFPVLLENGAAAGEILLLQGRPLGEPVAQYGPFVMSTAAELQQAFLDYRRTGFGGWPWPSDGPVHGTSPDRFARHPDGRQERPPA
jgi:quercetin 2,3-dioxygenase